MQVTSESDLNCFMSCGPDNFVALFSSDEPEMDHYCYSIDGYDPAEAMRKLETAGLSPRRRQDRVYFEDPDGLTVQVSSG